MNAPPRIKVNARAESWPIAGHFAISRGSKTQADVVVVELTDGAHRGRGECVPYGRYGENISGVLAAIEGQAAAIADGLDRADLQRALPPGAARNALDCALWDLEAKCNKTTAAALAGLPPPLPLLTAYTISIGTPDDMARAAKAAARYPLLK